MKNLLFILSEPVAYSEFAMRNNAAILDYCRTSMSALSGATAGIIGLTSFYGFAFYFITALVLSVSCVYRIVTEGEVTTAISTRGR